MFLQALHEAAISPGQAETAARANEIWATRDNANEVS